MYYETYRLLWNREWANGVRFNIQARTSKDTPTAALFYQPLRSGALSTDATEYQPYLRTYDLTLGIKFQPGVTWINTKRRRIVANNDVHLLFR